MASATFPRLAILAALASFLLLISIFFVSETNVACFLQITAVFFVLLATSMTLYPSLTSESATCGKDAKDAASASSFFRKVLFLAIILSSLGFMNALTFQLVYMFEAQALAPNRLDHTELLFCPGSFVTLNYYAVKEDLFPSPAFFEPFPALKSTLEVFRTPCEKISTPPISQAQALSYVPSMHGLQPSSPGFLSNLLDRLPVPVYGVEIEHNVQYLCPPGFYRSLAYPTSPVGLPTYLTRATEGMTGLLPVCTDALPIVAYLGWLAALSMNFACLILTYALINVLAANAEYKEENSPSSEKKDLQLPLYTAPLLPSPKHCTNTSESCASPVKLAQVDQEKQFVV